MDNSDSSGEESIEEMFESELGHIYKLPTHPTELPVPSALHLNDFQKLSTKGCSMERIEALYSFQHAFVSQLYDDHYLRTALSTLLNPVNKAYSDFSLFADPVKSSAMTIVRALDFRVQYIYALSDFVVEIFKLVTILTRRAKLVEETRKEINYVVDMLEKLKHFKEFKDLSDLADRIKKDFYGNIATLEQEAMLGMMS